MPVRTSAFFLASRARKPLLHVHAGSRERARGELDPKSPLNAVIVDLDKAPRNAHGMVEYSADFYILCKVD
jgi:hypothetical protein